MPATSTTVVHDTAWYASSIVTTRVRTRAPAASRPATDGGTAPVASIATMTTITDTRRAPGPNGTAWRRTASGR